MAVLEHVENMHAFENCRSEVTPFLKSALIIMLTSPSPCFPTALVVTKVQSYAGRVVGLSIEGSNITLPGVLFNGETLQWYA